MNRWFIRKDELRCRDILLDIRTRMRDVECTHKETNDGRGMEGERVYVFAAQNETWAIIQELMQRILLELRKIRVLGRE